MGSFCSDAMLDLAFPSTRINSGEYIGILNEKLMPFLEAQAEKTQLKIFGEYWPAAFMLKIGNTKMFSS